MAAACRGAVGPSARQRIAGVAATAAARPPPPPARSRPAAAPLQQQLRPSIAKAPLRRRSAPAAAAAGSLSSDGLPRPSSHTAQRGRGASAAMLALACVTMAAAAVHRVSFSVLAPAIQAELGLTTPQMGHAHAALLAGYLLGQIPAGVVADRVGGAHLAAASLFAWSAVCALLSLVPAAGNPFAALLAARAALGLAQSGLMPSISALSARWFAPAARARQTSTVYGSYSWGTVAGLALTPFLAQHVGWHSTFAVLGLAGMTAAAIGSLHLPLEGRAAEAAAVAAAAAPSAPAEPASERARSWRLSGGDVRHLLLLCLVHSVISWSFFILQAWLPTLLSTRMLGLEDLRTVGLLSALPWAATALVAVAAGGLADSLQTKHRWSVLRVRTTMQLVASGGTALSLLPLALPGVQVPPGPAVCLIVSSVAFSGFSYAGFHSYVQDVAPSSAGLVLAITNTCGSLLGLCGNILTGYLAASRWGYAGVFALTVGLNLASSGAWLAGARGQALDLHDA